MQTRSLAAGELTLRLAATRLDQETAGFITGEDAYRDEEIARSNPDPEAYRDAHSLRMSARYRNDGYILSQVIVPAQSVEGGVVRLQAIEGHVAAIF